MENIYKELLEYTRKLEDKESQLSSEKDDLEKRWKEIQAES